MHAGSLHAPDAALALRNARDVYTRRQEGVSLWVVRADDITASSPDEKDSFFDPAGRQDLSPPDLLRRARRRRVPVSGPVNSTNAPSESDEALPGAADNGPSGVSRAAHYMLGLADDAHGLCAAPRPSG